MAKTIENFFKELKECPDEKLRSNYKIYDNYPINLSGNREEIKHKLNNSPNFDFDHYSEKENADYFNYSPGIMIARLANGAFGYDIWKGNDSMKKDFNLRITLCPYQKKDMGKISYEEARKNMDSNDTRTAILNSLNDLTNVLIKENIPFCLPYSHIPFPDDPEKNLDAVNYSEMAKFIPEKLVHLRLERNGHALFSSIYVPGTMESSELLRMIGAKNIVKHENGFSKSTNGANLEDKKTYEVYTDNPNQTLGLIEKYKHGREPQQFLKRAIF